MLIVQVEVETVLNMLAALSKSSAVICIAWTAITMDMAANPEVGNRLKADQTLNDLPIARMCASTET